MEHRGGMKLVGRNTPEGKAQASLPIESLESHQLSGKSKNGQKPEVVIT